MLGEGGFGMFIRCTFWLLKGRNYLGWSLRWRMCVFFFFPVVGGFVPVAWVVVFLLVAGVLVAGVGEAEVFVFLVLGSLFSVVFFFLPLLLIVPAVSPPF